MIVNTLKIFFKYSERAFTPASFSALIQSNLQKYPLKDILHQLSLYDRNILIFDYDYFQKCCYRLLDFQKQIKTSDLIMILKLAQRHDLKNEMLWKHYEAQIQQRLNQQLIPLFEQEKLELQTNIQKAFRQFEENSQDFFNVLTEQNIQQQLTEEKNKIESMNTFSASEQLTIQQINGKNKKSQSQIFPFLDEIAQILILYGTQRTDLLRLLLEAQCHPKIHKATPQSIIKFTEILVYTCQILMQEYETNKQKYSGRSIKRIYKFQNSYVPQFFRMLSSQIQNFNKDQMKHLLEVMGSFPIKKRQNKKKIVSMVGNQLTRREILVSDYWEELQRIIGEDEKIKKKFRIKYEIGEEGEEALKIE